jgi:hypothetical protein
MARKTILVLLGVVAISPLLFGQNEKIAIQSHSRAGKYPLGDDQLLLYADLDEGSVILRCESSHKDCVVLPPGDYEIARLILGEGSYKNCANVDIYRIDADRSKGKPLGEYCLDYWQE